MDHTKEWHLQRVTKRQKAVSKYPVTDSYETGFAKGQLIEAISQAAHAGASLDEIKVARTAVS